LRALEGATHQRRSRTMVHAGLDLSRRRLDVCLVDETGEVLRR